LERYVHQRKLKLRRNFREYWVCATCGRPRRTKTSKTKPCKRCYSVVPPRVRIMRRRGIGDEASEDSRISDGLFKAVAIARKGLGLGCNEFPPGYPSRDILDSMTGYFPNPKSSHWYCKVFLGKHCYVGELEKEICLLDTVEEVAKIMLSEKKMMQIRISSDLHKWLKLYSAKHETTMTDIIINYLEYLRRRAEKSVKVEQI